MTVKSVVAPPRPEACTPGHVSPLAMPLTSNLSKSKMRKYRVRVPVLHVRCSLYSLLHDQ